MSIYVALNATEVVHYNMIYIIAMIIHITSANDPVWHDMHQVPSHYPDQLYEFASQNTQYCRDWVFGARFEATQAVVSINADYTYDFGELDYLRPDYRYTAKYECHVLRDFNGCDKDFLQRGLRFVFLNVCPYDRTLQIKLVPWVDKNFPRGDLRSTVYCVDPRIGEPRELLYPEAIAKDDPRLMAATREIAAQQLDRVRRDRTDLGADFHEYVSAMLTRGSNLPR